MQPYNYTIQTQNPFESAVSGLKLGMGLQDMQAQRQAQALKLQQEQQAMLHQQELQSRMQALMTNPNPTVKDYTNLAMLLPQKEAASMRANWEALSKDRQTKDLQSAGQVMAAFQSGAPEIGLQILRERADAAKNSGDTEQAKALETWAKMAEINPGAVTKSIGLMVAQLPGGEKVIESLGKIGTETRAQELHPTAVRKAGAEATTAEVGAEFAKPQALAELEASKWNVKNLQNQINVRGAQLNLDRQRLATDTQLKIAELGQKAAELPAGAQKLVNDAAVTAAAAKQQAAGMNDLSSRIMSIGTSWGAAGSASEWLKKVGGMQGGVTELRQEYTRLRNSAAVGSLPPGPATDKDIQMVLEGFPPSTASPEVLSRFLRGMAKLKDIEAGVEGAKVDWLASNRGALTRAGTSFVAGDYAVKAGETFPDFTAKVAKKVAEKYAGSGGSLVDQIPTDKNPNPGKDSSRIIQEADAIIRGGR